MHFLTTSFRPLPLPKSWLSDNRLRSQIFHSMISLPHKKFFFQKFLMTSLHVICSLGPLPLIKNSGYAYVLNQYQTFSVILGPKWKWCDTVPFPLETLFIGNQIERQYVFLR